MCTFFLYPAFPDRKPEISLSKRPLAVGDILDANCTSHRSKPAANITWLINEELVRIFSAIKCKGRNIERNIIALTRLLYYPIFYAYYSPGQSELLDVAARNPSGMGHERDVNAGSPFHSYPITFHSGSTYTRLHCKNSEYVS